MGWSRRTLVRSTRRMTRTLTVRILHFKKKVYTLGVVLGGGRGGRRGRCIFCTSLSYTFHNLLLFFFVQCLEPILVELYLLHCNSYIVLFGLLYAYCPICLLYGSHCTIDIVYHCYTVLLYYNSCAMIFVL